MRLYDLLKDIIEVKHPSIIEAWDDIKGKVVSMNTIFQDTEKEKEYAEGYSNTARLRSEEALTSKTNAKGSADDANASLQLAIQENQKMSSTKGIIEEFRNQTLGYKDSTAQILSDTRDEANKAKASEDQAKAEADRAGEKATEAEITLNNVRNEKVEIDEISNEVKELQVINREVSAKLDASLDIISSTLPGFSGTFITDKSVHPSSDDDGNALVDGTYYKNITDGKVYRFNGFAWKTYTFSPLDSMYLNGFTMEQLFNQFESDRMVKFTGDAIDGYETLEEIGKKIEELHRKRDIEIYKIDVGNLILTSNAVVRTLATSDLTVLKMIERENEYIMDAEIKIIDANVNMVNGSRIQFNALALAVSEGIDFFQPSISNIFTTVKVVGNGFIEEVIFDTSSSYDGRIVMDFDSTLNDNGVSGVELRISIRAKIKKV